VWKNIDESATDWNIEYVEGEDKGAIETLRDGQADCQGRSAVFIALCRANKIPARMVWVDGHVYPEFYLERGAAGRGLAPFAQSAEQKVPVPLSAGRKRGSKEIPGDWYPCESAGTRAFGEMPLARTILQKGDNFRVPERKTERLRYASDFMVGLPTPGGGRPKVKYIREQIVAGEEGETGRVGEGETQN
jgi:transglutaminase-like putative cysteine protease